MSERGQTAEQYVKEIRETLASHRRGRIGKERRIEQVEWLVEELQQAWKREQRARG